MYMQKSNYKGVFVTKAGEIYCQEFLKICVCVMQNYQQSFVTSQYLLLQGGRVKPP